jgi:hypothetical protein
VTIRDRDRGAKALLKKIRRSARVKVGIIGAAASADHDGVTNVEVGSFHEFGLGVPRRSFIADYVDQNVGDIESHIRKAAKRVVKGKSTIDQALELLGIYIQGEIQQRMAAGIPPPLKQTTIDRKGSSTPLIDTGQLRSAITYEVERQRSHG